MRKAAGFLVEINEIRILLEEVESSQARLRASLAELQDLTPILLRRVDLIPVTTTLPVIPIGGTLIVPIVGDTGWRTNSG